MAGASDEAVHEQLRAENVELRAMVADLEAKLAKNSHNSSRPPSSDPPADRADRADATMTCAERRAQEERERRAELRRRGKQPGAAGENLPASEDPGEVISHERARWRRSTHLGQTEDQPTCCRFR